MRTFIAQRLLFPLVRVYWKVFRPKTFGVKGLIVRVADQAVLLVRHAYGNRNVWNIPGGGFNPRRETAQAAVAREIEEELGLKLCRSTVLGEYATSAQGKRDTVTLFSCEASDTPIRLSDEIAETRWFSPAEVEQLEGLYTITRRTLDLHSMRAR